MRNRRFAETGAERQKEESEIRQVPKPFCVVSVGAFDFGKIMNLRKNRDAYTRFVLGIFGITERMTPWLPNTA